jgi:hypothetical protein
MSLLAACCVTANLLRSQSQSYVMTDGQSASLSWYQAPPGAQDPEFLLQQTTVGLLSRLSLLYSLSMNCIENTTSNSFSIVAYMSVALDMCSACHCLAMATLIIIIGGAVLSP